MTSTTKPSRAGRRSRRLWDKASSASRDTTRQRPVLRWLYERVIRVETGLADGVHRSRRGPVDPGNLTLVVKTFERPTVLLAMLRSVRRVFSGPIIVADDSRVPVEIDDPGVQLLRLPFDSGIGMGRNALLAAVDTEFVFMTDDDMHLMPDFDITRTIDYLTRNPEVDLCGGRVINLPLWQSAVYPNSALFAYHGEPRVRQGVVLDGLPVAYKAPNFYIGRTERIRAVGYDSTLKRLDHTDFFTSAYGELVCVLDRNMVCLHAKSFFDPHYLSFRDDYAADQRHLQSKWGSQSAAAQGRGLSPAEQTSLHHAAIETVAQDLQVEILHHGRPTDPSVSITVADQGHTPWWILCSLSVGRGAPGT